MRRSLRQTAVVSWLSILALLGQLLAPAVHAQSWAQRSGDPLLYAFCGHVSPELVKRWRQAAPPELLQKLDREQRQLQGDADLLSCSLCGALHAPQAGGSAVPSLALPAPQTAPAAVPASPAAGWRIADHRRSRGPPVSSLS